MKRIGFDIDGTILMNDNKYNLLRKVFPKFDENLHYTNYPLGDSLKMYGFVGEDFSNKGFYHEHKEIMFSEGTFYEGFKTLYSLLVEKGYEIYYVTARSPEYECFTKELFKLNNIPYENVYFLGSYNKVNTLKELEIDMFFEDNTDNIEQISSETDIVLGFIEAPYNKTYVPTNDKVHMFRNWENVLTYFYDQDLI